MLMPRICTQLLLLTGSGILAGGLLAAEHHGAVKASGLPIPGATVTFVQGDRKLVTTTDENGRYSFRDVPDGIWTVEVEMLGFGKFTKEIGVAANAPAPEWDLKLLSMAEILAASKPAPPVQAASQPAKPAPQPATVAAATAPPAESAPAPKPTAPAAAPSNGARPSIRQAVQAQQQGGRGTNGRGQPAGRGQQTGFQRADVNQAGEGANLEAGINPEMAADLSQSASDSFLVNGSVSRGLDMPQQPDWFGGRGGMGFDGMGPGGPGMGMVPGMGGPGDPNNGDNPGGVQMGPGGGRGGPGGGRGPGGPMMAGGPGAFGGRGPGGPGMGGPGGFGGRGGGPGGRGGGRGAGGRGPGARPGVAAFGNARRDRRMQYNGNLGLSYSNSALDAQSYSVTGNQVDKPAYANTRVTMMLGGPLRIPHLLSGRGGMFTLNYQFTRARNGVTNTYTVPSALERAGDFTQSFAQGPVTVFDPQTGAPFPGNIIPKTRIDPIAASLISYYPLPNFASTNRNYTVGIRSLNDSDNINSRLNQTINRKNRLSGGFAFQRGSNENPNLFGWIDSRTNRAMNYNASYSHTFHTGLIGNLNYRFSRQRNLTSPFFSNQVDIEGQLGITGVSTNPVNWGPPTLQFTNFSALSDGNASLSRNQTSAVTASVIWVHKLHNFNFGGEFRRQQNNLTADSNARGTFTFTGNITSQIVNGAGAQGTGFDLADFLLGRPATNSINYGNADKYFRSSGYAIYANDDWRLSTKLTLNFGLRWDYGTPITELYNRMVNLDIGPGFTAIAPVIAGETGSITGLRYTNALVHADKNNFSPRIGFAWRPIPKHSLRINGGFGLYYNTGAYNGFANSMAAQPPFAQNFAVATTLADPLSLNTFSAGSATITNTRAIDPFYRLGYAQIYQLSVQNDLGRALVGSLALNHTNGTGLDQQFLPNSLPPGSKLAGPGPAGYIYQTANGNSTFNSAQFNLMRRFRSGIAGNVSYMWSKAIDNGGIGTLIAQNWLNLEAERGLSNFDARHTLSARWQYQSGVGRAGGTLLQGWKGTLLKGWTISNTISLRTGSPLTANAGGNRSVVTGTGVTGPVRANATGLPLDAAQPGYGFNILAFAAPAAGQWGTAGRNTIPGPRIFSLNAQMSRNFRVGERKNLDFAIDATNVLNTVTITNWGTTITGNTFGLPTAAAGMRRINTSLRFRF